jgi:hypothetical protein
MVVNLVPEKNVFAWFCLQVGHVPWIASQKYAWASHGYFDSHSFLLGKIH